MLGSLVGRLYRGLVGRLLGLGPLVRESVAAEVGARLPELLRAEVVAILRGGIRPKTALDVEQAAYFIASISSAQYFLEHMRMAENLADPEALIRFSLEHCEIEGLVMEFGVYLGDSLRVLADATSAPVYGFDSFEGLPEDWTHFQKRGRFSLDGRLPSFDQPNVRLIPGWFEQTLPAFLEAHPGPARFIHVDSDIYRSAVTVFTHHRPRIVPGTVILFDEYFNYPGWEHHEFRAFQEFIRDTGLGYRYLGFASSHQSVAVKIAARVARAAVGET
jgi:hypothetical protein